MRGVNQKTAPTDAGGDAQSKQREAEAPLPRRTCLCRAEARMGLFVRSVGIAKAKTKIGMANLAHNLRRLSATSPNERRWSGSPRAQRANYSAVLIHMGS